MNTLLDAPAPNGLERHALELSLPVGGRPGEERLFNVDIDGDDVSDFVQLSCPGSPGAAAADPCLLVAKLSSGKTIEFAAPRFFLARFRAKVYAVSGKALYEIGASGVRRACLKPRP